MVIDLDLAWTRTVPLKQARRIRQLAARRLAPEEIAARLKLRPAIVRRVLGRSAQRGAPRKRAASATLSFITTPDVANRIREAAHLREVPVSQVLENIVRAALSRLRAPSPSKRRLSGAKGPASNVDRRRGVPTTTRGPAPSSRSGSRSHKGERDRFREAPVTAADAPEAVRKLLKSYDPRALRWRVSDHRYEIVLAVLTRGNEQAKQWLRRVLSSKQVRELVRKYRGAGCAEPARELLRSQLNLSKEDIPLRPYLGFEAGVSK